MAAREFPTGFLWGSNISAHHSEGNNTNTDWWEDEQARRSVSEPSGVATDSYHRYAEDWRLAASTGQNAIRFSIEWSRIEPSPGEFSAEALDHYREVIGSALELGLTPVVSLHHFTNPLWFARGGGWTRGESVDRFERYARQVGISLGDLIPMVNPINEPQSIVQGGYLFATDPPRMRDLHLGHRVTANLITAHAAAAQALRETTSARVGMCMATTYHTTAGDGPDHSRARDSFHRLMVGVYLEALATGRITGLLVPDHEVPGLVGADDFVGVHYYSTFVVDFTEPTATSATTGVDVTISPLPAERESQLGWFWHPEGLGFVLDEAAAAGLPIYVTENGLPSDDDAERIEFIRLHLGEIHDAIGRGLDIRGYFYWSIIDCYEWNRGFEPKFGLAAVDRTTMERIPKPSLAWYGALARANRLE
jgi:beta-glucosidase